MLLVAAKDTDAQTDLIWENLWLLYTAAPYVESKEVKGHKHRTPSRTQMKRKLVFHLVRASGRRYDSRIDGLPVMNGNHSQHKQRRLPLMS